MNVVQLLAIALAVPAIWVVGPGKSRAAEFDIAFKSCVSARQLGELSKVVPGNCAISTERLGHGHLVVRVSGAFKPEDKDRLRTLLAEHLMGFGALFSRRDAVVTLLMSGDGGDAKAAIEFAGEISWENLKTRVARGHRCTGLCALVFMAGDDRRLEAGGELAFGSFDSWPWPNGDGENKSGRLAHLRKFAVDAISFAHFLRVPLALMVGILKLDAKQVLPIDSVFWAKVAGITVDGARPPLKPTDEHYRNACNSHVDWDYGSELTLDAPPHFPVPDRSEEMSFIRYDDKIVIVGRDIRGSRYDYWCALNLSDETIVIGRQDIKAMFDEWYKPDSLGFRKQDDLAYRNYDEDVILKPGTIYFSREPVERYGVRSQNELALLMHPPETKLMSIADPEYRWNPERDLGR